MSVKYLLFLNVKLALDNEVKMLKTLSSKFVFFQNICRCKGMIVPYSSKELGFLGPKFRQDSTVVTSPTHIHIPIWQHGSYIHLAMPTKPPPILINSLHPNNAIQINTPDEEAEILPNADYFYIDKD